MGMDTRIDTHLHVVPPRYAAWLRSKGLDAGGMPVPEWSVEHALELMASIHIRCGVLSVSTPGVHLGSDDEARAMAREVNEFAAAVVRKHPDRFGFFATLTVPDIEGAIAEAAFAMDVLKADGVVLQASVRGTYLGATEWEPLMAELNSRAAVVFIHPGELPVSVPGLPAFGADFLLDTSRAAMCYAKSGGLEKFPNLKIVLSHGGGFVPYAAERMGRLCSSDGRTDSGVERLRKFYFDTALSSSRYALPSMLAFANPTHITFGSDWPYAAKQRGVRFAELLEQFPMNTCQRRAIDSGNALRLFPRLAAELGASYAATSVVA